MTDIREHLGRLGIWGHLPTLSSVELRPFAARANALGYGSLWVGEGAGREPYAVLAAVAEASGDMVLGTSVANIFGRDPMATKMAAMTMHELTGGRFMLGLGVSHAHLVEKLRGHTYEKPFTRMREYLAAYADLPYRGPVLPGPDGEPTEPPILIAALRPRLLELAATATAGTLPYMTTAARTEEMRRALDAAAIVGRPRPLLIPTVPVLLESDATAARERAREWIAPYGRAPNYQASLRLQGFDEGDWEPPHSDRLLDSIVAWGDASAIEDRLAQHADAGANHVAVIPLSTRGPAGTMEVLEALAPLG